MADALDVGATAVSNAVVRGWFPSSWFLVVNDLAGERGIPCPPDLFKMKSPSTQSVDGAPCVQGVGDE